MRHRHCKAEKGFRVGMATPVGEAGVACAGDGDNDSCLEAKGHRLLASRAFPSPGNHSPFSLFKPNIPPTPEA